MARKQTRRSISISREAYDALKVEAERRAQPMAMIVEELIRVEVGLVPKTRVSYPIIKMKTDMAGDPLPGDRMIQLPGKVVRVPWAPAHLKAMADQAELNRRREANEREDRAFNNPCRRPWCKRQPPIHEAHDD